MSAAKHVEANMALHLALDVIDFPLLSRLCHFANSGELYVCRSPAWPASREIRCVSRIRPALRDADLAVAAEARRRLLHEIKHAGRVVHRQELLRDPEPQRPTLPIAAGCTQNAI